MWETRSLCEGPSKEALKGTLITLESLWTPGLYKGFKRFSALWTCGVRLSNFRVSGLVSSELCKCSGFEGFGDPKVFLAYPETPISLN